MKGSGMPRIRSAMNGWTRRITIVKRTQQVVDGFVRDQDKAHSFRGTIQPLSPKEIELKPDGQRAWEWLQIHCVANDASFLQPNDKFVYNGKNYKIMAQNDYSLNGFVEYHAVRDYQNGVP